MTRVVGVDLSLTSTGLAVSTGQGIEVRRVRSDADDGTIPARSLRLRRLVGHMWAICSTADLVVIEAPAFAKAGGKASGHAHDRSGLWWLLVARLTGNGVPVAQVSPGTLKVYATGAGRGSKDEVLISVVRRWPAVNVNGNDEADALVLCSMGLRHLGEPFESLPQTHVRAMQAVQWPTIPDRGEPR